MIEATKRVGSNYLSMKKPCSNCPFLKEGGIELQPGRLFGIIRHLRASDYNGFPCHKTTMHDEDGEGTIDTAKEKFCAGAMIYLEKIGRLSVLQRVGIALGFYHRDKLMQHADRIIDAVPYAAEEE